MRRYWWMKALAFLVLAPAFVAALSFVVMLLWNALVPHLFSGPLISFWQAVGLLVLCRILFGGFRGRGGHGHWKHHWAQHERWHRMTPQEREHFREEWRKWRHMSHEERRAFRDEMRASRRGFCGPGSWDRRGGASTPDEGTQPKEG